MEPRLYLGCIIELVGDGMGAFREPKALSRLQKHCVGVGREPSGSLRLYVGCKRSCVGVGREPSDSLGSM